MFVCLFTCLFVRSLVSPSVSHVCLADIFSVRNAMRVFYYCSELRYLHQTSTYISSYGTNDSYNRQLYMILGHEVGTAIGIVLPKLD